MAPGVQKTVADAVYDSLLEGGAVPRLVGCTLGKVATIEGGSLDVALSFETGPSVLYDAVVVPGGAEALDALLHDANALDFVRAQYRHCKPILMLGSEGKNFLDKAGIPTELPDGSADSAIIWLHGKTMNQTLGEFKTASSGHRSDTRERDPPKA